MQIDVKRWGSGRQTHVETLRDWGRDCLNARGVTGLYEIKTHMRPWSRMLEYITEDTRYFLKEYPQGYENEPRITQAIARIFPNYAPLYIGEAPELACFMVKNCGARLFEDQPPPADLIAMHQRHMRFQQSTMPHVEALHREGAPVIGPKYMASAIASPFRRRDWLRADGVGEPMLEELAARRPDLERAKARLLAPALPMTLVHMDFAPANVFMDGTAQKAIDWADAAIGSPLLDVAPLPLEFVQTHRDALLEPWSKFGQARLIEELWAARVMYYLAVIHIATSKNPHLANGRPKHNEGLVYAATKSVLTALNAQI